MCHAQKPKQQSTLAPSKAPTALPLHTARSGSAQAAAVPQKAEKKRAAPALEQDVVSMPVHLPSEALYHLLVPGNMLRGWMYGAGDVTVSIWYIFSLTAGKF